MMSWHKGEAALWVLCQKCSKTVVFACPPASAKGVCLLHACSCAHRVAAKVAPWCFVEQNASLVAPVGISHSCQADLRWQEEEEEEEVSSSSSGGGAACLDRPLEKKIQKQNQKTKQKVLF